MCPIAPKELKTQTKSPCGHGCKVRTMRTVLGNYTAFTPQADPLPKGTGQHFLMGLGWLLLFLDGSWMDECGT